MATATKREKQDTDVVGTLMSLTIAFTLAMAFRGFVLEGFVIPTGSMGPTLMGEHVRVQSPVTGFEYPADSQMARLMMAIRDPRNPNAQPTIPIVDPMVSSRLPIEQRTPMSVVEDSRAGDRVLVLKPLFAFTRPQRWDVVGFKMPVDPAVHQAHHRPARRPHPGDPRRAACEWPAGAARSAGPLHRGRRWPAHGGAAVPGNPARWADAPDHRTIR